MRFIRFRRASALMLTFFLIVSLFGAGNVASAKNDKNAGKQNTTEEQNYVLYSENITVNGKRYAKPANAISNETILNNLLGTLGLDTKKEANLIFNGNDYALTEATYVDGKVALNGKRVHITKSLVAKGDIIINASDVTIADGAMILSTEGKVAINCSNLTAGGLFVLSKVFSSPVRRLWRMMLLSEKRLKFVVELTGQTEPFPLKY